MTNKIKVSCPKCSFTMTIEAEDPYKTYNYMTDGATVCRICNTKLRFQERI